MSRKNCIGQNYNKSYFIKTEIENYLDRNKRIYGDNKSANYEFAKQVRRELLSSEGEWREDNEDNEDIKTTN